MNRVVCATSSSHKREVTGSLLFPSSNNADVRAGGGAGILDQEGKAIYGGWWSKETKAAWVSDIPAIDTIHLDCYTRKQIISISLNPLLFWGFVC